MPLRRFTGLASMCVLLALAAAPWQDARAQDGHAARLADMRYALNEVYFTLQSLRLELIQSELQLQPASPTDGGLVQRIDAIEAEVRSSLDQIKQLEFRINEVAAEGIHSVRALREKIVQIEQEIGKEMPPVSADAGQDSLPLLGETGTTAPPDSLVVTRPQPGVRQPESASDPDLVVGLPGTPERAIAALEMQKYNDAVTFHNAEDYPAAIAAINDFLATYPRSPLESRARLYLAESHAAMGQFEEARKSYLASILADRGGDLTPIVMLRLGQGLMNADQYEQACRLLRTLTEQYPNHTNARIAGRLMQQIACRG